MSDSDCVSFFAPYRIWVFVVLFLAALALGLANNYFRVYEEQRIDWSGDSLDEVPEESGT